VDHPDFQLQFDNLLPFWDADLRVFGVDEIHWESLEPSESSGYLWDSYDAAIQQIQACGGEAFPTIWSISAWATPGPNASAPKPEYRDRYGQFIREFVERYDNDGTDDMPGLTSRHRYVQIEDEAENTGTYWSMGPECAALPTANERYRCAGREYGEMLKLAYGGAKEADSSIQVVSFSFNTGDIFDDNPLAAPQGIAKYAFLDEVLTNYAEYFDVLAVQCNYDYTGVGVWIDYLRDHYALGKPIICADAASMPMLGRHQLQDEKYVDQYPFKTDAQILEILFAGPTDSSFAEIKPWWEAEKARLSVKKLIVAAGAGAAGVYFQFIMSRPGPGLSWSHSGLLSAGTPREADGPQGTPRAVVHAFEPLYVVWSDSGPTAIDMTSHVVTQNVRAKEIVTQLDTSYQPVTPDWINVAADAVPISSTPLIVAPASG
jgi:hypothetical protein